MALTSWNRELGTTQGRVQPQGVAPAEGGFVFALGRDLPGLHHRFEVGDFVEVAQTASFGGATLVRVRARLRPPAAMPVGAAWKASLQIDGVERVTALLSPGRTRDRVDLAANVSKLTGEHALAFRLELVVG